MSISRVILLVLLGIGGIMVVFLGVAIWSALADYRQISRITTASSAGTVALSLERSVTQVALSLDTPVPGALRSLIDRQRSEAPPLLDEATAALEGTVTPAGVAFLAAVRESMAKVGTLRSKVNAMPAIPGDQRDAARAKPLPFELKREISRLKGAGSYLVPQKDVSSNIFAALPAVQDRAWETHKFGGRVRT